MSFMSMSIWGSILIIAVSTIRSLGRRYLPARFFVLLWIVISLRLLVPWSFDINLGQHYPLFPKVPFSDADGADSSVNAKQNGQLEKEKQTGTTTKNSAIGTDDFGTKILNRVKHGQNTLEHHKAVFGIAWLAGIIACLGCIYFKGHDEHQILKESILLTKEELQQLKEYIRMMNQNDIPLSCFLLDECRLSHVYYVSDRTRTPVTVGVFRPRIVLSRTMTSEEPGQLMYVLLHECVHVKRKDTLIKTICLLAVCAHWFNPFGWIMFHFLKQDIEYACDEAVIQITGPEHRKKYANSIVLMATSHEFNSLINTGFSADVLKRRIIRIMKYKDYTKTKFIGCAAFLIIFVMLSFVREKVYAVKDVPSEGTVISETESNTLSTAEEAADQWVKKIYYNSNGGAVTEEVNYLDEKGNIVKNTVHHLAGVPEGSITEFSLDSSGRHLTGQVYRENGTSAGITLDYLYSDSSDRVSGILINESGEKKSEEYQYDSAGNVISCTVKDDSGNEIMNTHTINTYDASSGQLEKSESVTRFGNSEEDKPQTKTSLFHYDNLGRLVREDLYNEDTEIGYYEYYYSKDD